MDPMGWHNITPDLDFVELVMDTPRTVQTEKAHVVYTRGANGQARLYIDGEEVESGEIGGDFSPWDPALRLALGDEFVGERGWLGTYHHVAIYNRALKAAEIADHHKAGVPEHVDGLQARYSFDEGKGSVVRDGSGRRPALDLHIKDTGAVRWQERGLELTKGVLIATEEPAERLAAAMQDTNAIAFYAENPTIWLGATCRSFRSGQPATMGGRRSVAPARSIRWRNCNVWDGPWRPSTARMPAASGDVCPAIPWTTSTTAKARRCCSRGRGLKTDATT